MNDAAEKIFNRFGVDVRDVTDRKVTSRIAHLRAVNDDLRLSQPVAGSPHTEEIGQSGLRVVHGRTQNTETNRDFRPVAVRGLRTKPGLYHELSKSHDLVQRWLTDTTLYLQQSDWEVTIDAPEGYEHQAEALKRRTQRAIDRMDPDLDDIIGDVVQAPAIGFAMFETVYYRHGDIKKIANRRAHAVNRWVWDKKIRTLEGAELVRGDRTDYVLEGDQMALVRWMPDGDDPEGSSQLRSVARLIEAQRLLRQIQMVAAERKGAGYVVGEGDPDLTNAETETIEQAIRQMLATDNPYTVLPPGWKLRLVSPQGQVPDFDGAIRALAEYIAIALGAERYLVGMGDTGTYSLMSEKREEAHSKTAGFARLVERLFNSQRQNPIYRGIIPTMVDYWGGPVAGVYPKLQRVEPEGETDYSTIRELATDGLITWTDEDERRAREELGMPPLDETAEPREVGQADGGDQSMMMSQSGCECCDGDSGKKKPAIAPLTLAQIDQQRIEKWLSASENSIGKVLARIGRQHRDAATSRLEGETSRRRIVEVLDALRSQFVEDYENAVRGEIRRMVVRGNAAVLAEMGILPNMPQIPADEDEAVRQYALPTAEFDDLVDGIAARIARHAANVTTGYLEDRNFMETEEAVEDRQRPDIPSTSAYASTAGTYISEPFNFGRDQVVQRMQNVAKARGFPEDIMVAERTAMMDRNTCEKCEALDETRYIVGSDNYRAHLPPKAGRFGECDGGRRCRCMMSYIVADEEGFEAILDEVAPQWRQRTMLSGANDDQATFDDALGFLEEMYAAA